MSSGRRHIELRNMVGTWIGNRCIKMSVLPECNIVGYIADFVAIAKMNSSEHKRYCRFSKLKPKSMSHIWQGKGMPLKTVINGDIDRHYVCVFEVKVSRSDFLNTFGGKKSPHAKARMAPVGTAHWVVAEKGICEPKELPDHWGLLVPYGAGLSEKKPPKLNILPEKDIHAMVFDMLWQQMNNRTSYYDQIIEMAGTIKNVRNAIVRDKPRNEILHLSDEAIKACRRLVI